MPGRTPRRNARDAYERATGAAFEADAVFSWLCQIDRRLEAALGKADPALLPELGDELEMLGEIRDGVRTARNALSMATVFAEQSGEEEGGEA